MENERIRKLAGIPLEERVGSTRFNKLIKNTAKEIMAEADRELRKKDLSDLARKTRITALVDAFKDGLDTELRTIRRQGERKRKEDPAQPVTRARF